MTRILYVPDFWVKEASHTKHRQGDSILKSLVVISSKHHPSSLFLDFRAIVCPLTRSFA